MSAEQARRDALNRAKRQMGEVPRPPKPEATPPDDMVEEELGYVFIAEENATQFSGSSLEQGKDIVIYVKIHMFRPEALKNIEASGKTVFEIASSKKGIFLVCNEKDAGDIVKALIEDSIKGNS